MINSFIFLILIITTISCSSIKEWTKGILEPKSKMDEVHEQHRPLEKQRLVPRPGYEGYLTNRICLKWYGSKCEKESIKKYSLKDRKVRENFIELQFACHVGGKRYRICPDKAGFCRKEKHSECAKWGRKNVFNSEKVCKKWKDKIVKKYLDSVTDLQFLLDGATECKKGL